MFASSNMRPCFFRYGYDIAVPLRADKLIDGLRDTPPLGRKYFATFKVLAFVCLFVRSSSFE